METTEPLLRKVRPETIAKTNGHLPEEEEEILVDLHKHDIMQYVSCFAEFGFTCLYALYVYIRLFIGLFVEPEKKSLKDEVILITGGANGIGKEVCRVISRKEKNVKVVIWDVDDMSLDGLVKELRLHGVKDVRGYVVDVTNQKAVEESAKMLRREVGDVTILISNAGIAGPVGEAWRMNPDKVMKTLLVNLVSHTWMIREFLPSMLKNNHGHIVEMCSILSFCAGRWGSPYVASKQGLKGYLESVKEDIRHENRDSKVKVTMVFPSFTDTGLIANVQMRCGKYPFLMQPISPQVVAEAIVDGMQKNKEYIYVPQVSWWASWLTPLVPMDVCRKVIDICDVTGKKNLDPTGIVDVALSPTE